MTDQTPETEQAPWDDEPEQTENWDGSPKEVSFPELPPNPHNHVYTWSPKLPDGSMLVVRSNTAAGLAEAAEALTAVSGRLAAAWRQVAGGGAPGPQMPFQGQQAATPPPFGPNVSVPAAPGYVGPPASQMPQQQGWGGAPQGGGFGGQQGQRKEYPAPQGWYRLNGARKEQVDAVAGQYGIPKGNPAKGGKYNFWGLTPTGQPGKAWYCAPEVAQAFAQFNPVPA